MWDKKVFELDLIALAVLNDFIGSTFAANALLVRLRKNIRIVIARDTLIIDFNFVCITIRTTRRSWYLIHCTAFAYPWIFQRNRILFLIGSNCDESEGRISNPILNLHHGSAHRDNRYKHCSVQFDLHHSHRTLWYHLSQFWHTDRVNMRYIHYLSRLPRLHNRRSHWLHLKFGWLHTQHIDWYQCCLIEVQNGSFYDVKGE